MHPLGTFAFLGLVAATPATPVDFKLVEAAPSQPTPLAEQAASPTIPAGFGNQVPLSFAARQIVPHGVAIRLTPGVDPNAPVTWAGGRPWPQVLTTAVAPLGYRVSVTRTVASITD